jgi:hypothetical protein
MKPAAAPRDTQGDDRDEPDVDQRQVEKMMADMKTYNALPVEEKNELVVKQ